MRSKDFHTERNARRGTKRRRGSWKMLLCVAVLSLLAIDVYKFIPRFRYWSRNREIKQGYIDEVQRLRQEHERLKEEIDKLEHSLLAQERLAREMGYIKPGETVYKLAPRSRDGNSSAHQGSVSGHKL